MTTKKFETFGEFVLAVKQESDSKGAIVDERLELNTELVKPCPTHGGETSDAMAGKLYYCNDCRSFWHF